MKTNNDSDTPFQFNDFIGYCVWLEIEILQAYNIHCSCVDEDHLRMLQDADKEAHLHSMETGEDHTNDVVFFASKIPLSSRDEQLKLIAQNIRLWLDGMLPQSKLGNLGETE